MSDDIVTRLRERIPYAIHPHVLAEAKLLSDAVKEIERLRKERIRWERIAHDLYRRVDVYGEVCSCNDYDKHWCGLHAYEDEIRGLKERGSA